MCVKESAPPPRGCLRRVAAPAGAGKRLMPAQPFRCKATSQAMKREIESGALGNIYHARAWMLRRNGLIPTPTFIRRELSGGGPCIDIGVHILDLTLWLMGNPQPVAVTGVARTELACLLYTSPSPRDRTRYRMPSSA